MPDRAQAVVHLHADQVSVVVDVTEGRLPSILHWGHELGDLAAEDAAALVASSIRPLAGNVVDRPVRVAVLPSTAPAGWPAGPERFPDRPRLVAGIHRHPGELDGRAIEPTAEVTLVSADAGILNRGSSRRGRPDSGSS